MGRYILVTHILGMRVKFPEEPEWGVGTVKWKGTIKGPIPYIGIQLDNPGM